MEARQIYIKAMDNIAKRRSRKIERIKDSSITDMSIEKTERSLAECFGRAELYCTYTSPIHAHIKNKNLSKRIYRDYVHTMRNNKKKPTLTLELVSKWVDSLKRTEW